METQKEKSLNINFDVFLSLTGIKKIVNIFKMNPRQDIINQADFLIKTQNYEAYTTMLQKGYSPTKQQQEKIENFIDDILSKCPVGLSNTALILYENLEHLLEKGLTLNYKNVARFIRSDYKQTTSKIDLGGLSGNKQVFYNQDYIIGGTDSVSTDPDHFVKFPNLTKQFRNIIAQPSFSTYLFKEFNQSLVTKFPKPHPLAILNEKTIDYDAPNKERSAYHTIRRYEQVLTHAPQLIFKTVDFKEVSAVIEKLHYSNISHKHANILNNIVNNLYKKDLNNIFEDTKANFSSNLVQNLAIENIINEKHTIKDLPQTALKIVDDIESLYKKIKESCVENNEQMHEVNILIDKRLPEVLSKYLKVDLEYRTTLKSSQGKNAQDLMIDSLENIKSSFINVFEQINQNNVNSLSVTNRYTQSLKMK